eukprot:CAMPEP_0194329240 /NCGR_PEP_ID=MMETSP0171-20130528/47595_1 /TAXON_ID=218684 /ORGANISM="Corethron pennatum, Strain L29A3" /LENGTH=64 /DNA_ID=CAMNT_0039089913 /DNA_START=355 /DNA_END=549 /DNA_ORIENTATION=+
MACVASGKASKSSSRPEAKSPISLTDARIDAFAARSNIDLDSVARAALRSAKPVSPPSGGVACT